MQGVYCCSAKNPSGISRTYGYVTVDGELIVTFYAILLEILVSNGIYDIFKVIYWPIKSPEILVRENIKHRKD